jgi:large subunit ribosomal protein L24
MKIKKGDTVIITSGSRKDKKKVATVLEIIKGKDMVVVEGVNIKKKVTRDTKGDKTMVDVEYPVHVSNVMFYDEKAKAGSRIAVEGTGKDKNRVTKKSGTTIK